MKNSLTLFLLSLNISILYAEGLVIGCDITSKKEESCNESSDIFSKDTTSTFKLDTLKSEEKSLQTKYNLDTKSIKITEKLSLIRVEQKKKIFTIERHATKEHLSCPPSCIQPMNIENIKTVGTLETIKFIESSNKNRHIILLDSRGSSEYKKETIPMATNIPYSIIKKNSKYSDIILKLLGGKRTDKKWDFSNVYQLLIFDNGIWDEEASKVIHRLIELKYPQNKILYYYGGLKNWKEAGLTTTY